MMDVVIFRLATQHYALPAVSVLKVLFPVPVTPLPYAPVFVDGLVNVDGRVVLQLDAAVRLGSSDRLAFEKGSIMLLQQSGTETAIHVDHVLIQTSIQPLGISQRCNAGDQASSFPVIDEFVWRDMPVFLLDGSFFGLNDLQALEVPGDGGGILGVPETLQGLHAQSAGDGRSHGEFMCLMLGIAEEHYALRISDIDEVVDEYELSLLPHAPREIAGLALLRGRATLVISLRQILALENKGEELRQWMVVVRHAGMRFGMLVDQLAGFSVFCQNELQVVEHGHEISAYLHEANLGLVGLLEVKGLLAPSHLEHYQSYLVSQDALGSKAQPALVRSVIRRFLSFRLLDEWYVVDLAKVDRIEECQGMTRVPEAHAGQYMRGVVHVHGDIVPVLDISGIESRLKSQNVNRQLLMLLRHQDDGLWALMVSSVHSVIEIAESDIISVPAVSHDAMESVARHEGRLYSVLSVEGVSQLLKTDGKDPNGR